MINRIPLIVDADSQRIKELPTGDNLDLTGNSISSVRDIIPETDSTYDLGSSSKKWKDLHLSGTIAISNGGTGATTAAGARTNLGSTTIGDNLFTLSNPGVLAFPRFNDDNTVSSLSDVDFRTAVSAQETLVSGTNIKTINSESILGAGDITLSTNLSSLTDVTITTLVSGQVLKYNGTIWVNDTDADGISLTDLSVTVGSASGNGNLSYNNTNGVFSFAPADLSDKQDTLVSGTSIKTVNNESILGSGNITISGGATIATKSDNVEYKLIFTDETSSAQQNAYINADKLFFNASTGQLNATVLNSLSDENQKTNIVPITSATTTIMQLNGVEFNWKDNGNKSAGVIAQQLEEILPHLVYTSSDGLKSVNYSGITGYLIEAIKEQQKQIDELKKCLNE